MHVRKSLCTHVEVSQIDPVYLMAIGAGLKGTAVGFVKQALGGAMGGGLAGISDDMLAIGLGYLGKSKLKGDGRDIATGVLIAGVAGIVEGTLGGMPLLGGGVAPTTGAVTTAPTGPLTLEQEAARL